MNAIELKDVTFSYEGAARTILEHVNFSVAYGELALLSGFSGEGKSTVLSLIAGIIPNVTPGTLTGEVRIGGEDITGQTLSQVCRRVGVVLQNADAQIIQQLVEDEVAFGCENFSFPREKIQASVQRACQQMRLAPQWKTRTLSGGQKQRLITAATLATEQKILVLDEPLANLDKTGAALLMEALQALSGAGYAVLVVEHRLDMVLPYVDSVWSIQKGTVSKVENKQEYLSAQARHIPDTSVPAAAKEAVFSLEHVGFSIKKREILRDVTFTIQKGERVLLLGENGCGKTTLLRLIARLYAPTKGTLRQTAAPSRRADSAWFRAVGVVYQNPNYQLFMPTVWQEIAFGAKSQEDAREVMERFGLTHLAEQHPQSLSEGQKRRVSIAAVVASAPSVLLLDEPTVGQDYEGLREMVQILNDLHTQTGSTMITVTHDMRCAEALCDHAILIENGMVAEEGGKELAHRYFFGTAQALQ